MNEQPALRASVALLSEPCLPPGSLVRLLSVRGPACGEGLPREPSAGGSLPTHSKPESCSSTNSPWANGSCGPVVSPALKRRRAARPGSCQAGCSPRMGGLGWPGVRAGWAGSRLLSGDVGAGAVPSLPLASFPHLRSAGAALSGTGAATVPGVHSWTVVEPRFLQKPKHRPGSLGLSVTWESRAEMSGEQGPQQRGPVLRFTSRGPYLRGASHSGPQCEEKFQVTQASFAPAGAEANTYVRTPTIETKT